MFRLADWPIRRKLGFLIGVGSLVALLLACAAFSVHEVQMIREAKVTQITALADILGSNAIPSLEFDDPITAAEVLDSLRLQPSVEAAALYDAMGGLLATYPAAPPTDEEFTDEPLAGEPDSRELPAGVSAQCPPAMVATFTDDGYLAIAEEIFRDGEKVGTVYLRSNLKEIGKQLSNVFVIAMVVMTLSLTVAMLITGRLQRLFTVPIQELVGAVKVNSVMGGAAKHVKKHGSDEMGALCDGFNAMVLVTKSAHPPNPIYTVIFYRARPNATDQLRIAILASNTSLPIRWELVMTRPARAMANPHIMPS